MLVSKKWDERFMTIAKEVATWSKDPSTKVGCVITKGKYRIAEGYNGFPSGIPDSEELLNDRKMRLYLTDHAERNAIDTATVPLDGCTIYVTSHPCANCAKAIAKAGIKKVYYLDGTPEFNERWKEEIEIAQFIFQKYKIFYHSI